MTTLRLRGRDIDGDRVSCTIAQLTTIFATLAALNNVLDLVWYQVDVEPPLNAILPPRSHTPEKIGSVHDVVTMLTSSPLAQLDFGVFIGSPPAAGSVVLEERISAEGPSRRRSLSSMIEVVAFDDTFIEITTEQSDMLQTIRDRFGGIIVAE